MQWTKVKFVFTISPANKILFKVLKLTILMVKPLEPQILTLAIN